MKESWPKQNKKKEVKMTRRDFLTLGTIGAMVAGTFAWKIIEDRDNKPQPETKRQESAEEYILKKLTRKEQILSKFTPVFIYYSPDGKNGKFAGCGSLFEGNQGEQIVTAEHLFRKELGEKMFAFRKLRPYEDKVTHGIERVTHTGSSVAVKLGKSPDIAFLKTGNIQPIQCFSEEKLEHQTGQYAFQKIESPQSVRSLISEEKVKILGTATTENGNGIAYTVLEYSSVSGESGTGFVDEKDEVYVLKGSGLGSKEVEQALRKFFQTTQEPTLAYGPLRIN